MKLINTDGMALIGPGSEWLWSTVAGLVAVVTLLAIYRQLRMARGARVIAEIEAARRDFYSEAMTRRGLAILEALHDSKDPLDLPVDALTYVGNYFDDLGYLVRKGHLDREFVHDYFGSTIRTWWGWLGPAAIFFRPERANPRIARDFEWLAGQMAELDRKAGVTRVYDEGFLAREIPGTIAGSYERIRLAEELRTVIVRSPLGAEVSPAKNATKRQPAAASRPALPGDDLADSSRKLRGHT